MAKKTPSNGITPMKMKTRPGVKKPATGKVNCSPKGTKGK